MLGVSSGMVGLAFDITLDGGSLQSLLAISVAAASRQALVEVAPGVTCWMGATQITPTDLENQLASYFSSAGAWDAPVDGNLGGFGFDFSLNLPSSVTTAKSGVQLMAFAPDAVPEPSQLVHCAAIVAFGILIRHRTKRPQ